jgi:hypothetical protein
LIVLLAFEAGAQAPGQRTTRLDSVRVSVPDTTGPSVVERGDTLVVITSQAVRARMAGSGVPAQLADTLRALFAPDTVSLLVRRHPGAPLTREHADPWLAYAFRLIRESARAMRQIDAVFESFGIPVAAP